MKTQISRNSFKAAKRYSGVYQQQGRMLTDADWNNLVDVLKGHLAEALKDVVGAGSPRTGKLKITTDRQIQPGDLYVGGLRAELSDTAPIDADKQPDFPGSPNLPEAGPYIVYADVWERSLTALEDPDLRDAALNGADTCTRTQTMLQVKICPEDLDPEKDIPQHGDAALTLTLHDNQESGDPCDPCAGQVGAAEERIGNYLFRLEVHAAELTEGNLTSLTLKWSSENGAEQYEALDEAQMPPGFVVSGRYTYEFFDLWSESHLGVHLNPDPDFSPTLGELKQTYVIPDEESVPKKFVRRWDGYCKLGYDGSVWSLVEGFDTGVTLSTEVADTAPGYVSLDSLHSLMRVNLEALKLELLLNGTFVAGDYWLAPVREAEHVPDSTENDPDNTVLAGSPPEGIVHHYLRLTRVEADGTVDLLDNDDAEKRRHNFPPLTDLLAHDVGYLRDPGKCTNGLFDDSHDNVEKALNRLCELAAEHVDYQADCNQGLFQGFDGTVQQALDKICTIRAEDVRFSKPCDTGFYQGKSVATVADALKLLCDVQTGGCKITVGEGGIFQTVEEAIEALLKRGQRNICLCLLPGRHMLTGRLFRAPLSGVQLCISGCGPCTQLVAGQAPTHFDGFDILCLADLEIITHQANGALIYENCRDVSLRNTSVYGFTDGDPLIRVSTAHQVTMQDLMLEAAGPASLENPRMILDPFPVLADLYKAADRTIFDTKAAEAAKELSARDAQDRNALAKEIIERTNDAPFTLSSRERRSYLELVEQLRRTPPSESRLNDTLQSIRREAIRMRPGVALSIIDAKADWSLRDCDILGIIVFYGINPSGPLDDITIRNLDKKVTDHDVTFTATTATFRASGCRITRVDISESLGQRLKNVAQQNGVIDGFFSAGTLGECTLVVEDSQIALFNTQITSSVFEVAKARAALVMGDSSIYVGNRGEGESNIVNITPENRTKRAANLGLVISP